MGMGTSCLHVACIVLRELGISRDGNMLGNGRQGVVRKYKGVEEEEGCGGMGRRKRHLSLLHEIIHIVITSNKLVVLSILNTNSMGALLYLYDFFVLMMNVRY